MSRGRLIGRSGSSTLRRRPQRCRALRRIFLEHVKKPAIIVGLACEQHAEELSRIGPGKGQRRFMTANWAADAPSLGPGSALSRRSAGLLVLE